MIINFIYKYRILQQFKNYKFLQKKREMFPYFNMQALFMHYPLSIHYYDQSIQESNLTFMPTYYNMINPNIQQTGIFYQNALNFNETNKIDQQCDDTIINNNFDYFDSKKQNFLKNNKFQEQRSSCKLSKKKLIRKGERQLISLTEKMTKQNGKKSNISKQQKQQQYSLKNLTYKKKTINQQHLLIKYRKKNTQSNVVNRIYSFLINETKNQTTTFWATQKHKLEFLKYLRVFQEALEGTVKREFFDRIMKINNETSEWKEIQILYLKNGNLSMEQFSLYCRKFVSMYLTKNALISIITSKKMKKQVWREHIQKIRELKQYFFDNIQTIE